MGRPSAHLTTGPKLAASPSTTPAEVQASASHSSLQQTKASHGRSAHNGVRTNSCDYSSRFDPPGTHSCICSTTQTHLYDPAPRTPPLPASHSPAIRVTPCSAHPSSRQPANKAPSSRPLLPLGPHQRAPQHPWMSMSTTMRTQPCIINRPRHHRSRPRHHHHDMAVLPPLKSARHNMCLHKNPTPCPPLSFSYSLHFFDALA
jgi:hypothetical protein